jgi:hypothetical protein
MCDVARSIDIKEDHDDESLDNQIILHADFREILSYSQRCSSSSHNFYLDSFFDLD